MVLNGDDMSKIIRQRMSAYIEGAFVVFLIRWVAIGFFACGQWRTRHLPDQT